MVPLFRLGLGGRLGSGSQWWSFVSLADEIAALTFLLDHELAGPVNVTAPDAATQAEVAQAMGAVLHRPALVPAPRLALRAVLGEFSSEVLNSIRVVPAALGLAGFHWKHPTLEQAVATLA
jgi:NAD dependent epimerase/dehydratase family enzyme